MLYNFMDRYISCRDRILDRLDDTRNLALSRAYVGGPWLGGHIADGWLCLAQFFVLGFPYIIPLYTLSYIIDKIIH